VQDARLEVHVGPGEAEQLALAKPGKDRRRCALGGRKRGEGRNGPRGLPLPTRPVSQEVSLGFAWRTLAGVPTLADRARLDAGKAPGEFEPPEPPGFDVPRP
jgi:hypothetical protein